MASCQYLSIGVWGENGSTGRGNYMNYRMSNLTFALLLSCLFLFLQLPTVVLSEDLTGEVVGIDGNQVTVKLSTEKIPRPGDLATLFLEQLCNIHTILNLPVSRLLDSLFQAFLQNIPAPMDGNLKYQDFLHLFLQLIAIPANAQLLSAISQN